MPLQLTADELNFMSDKALCDLLLNQGAYAAGYLQERGIDPTTPHLFRFMRNGKLRYPHFQFLLDDECKPSGIRFIIPLINAMNTDRYGVDRDEDEAHRAYLLRFWITPITALGGVGAYEALLSGRYTHRQIQQGILSLWIN